MQVTPWAIYWLTRLDGVCFVLELCVVMLLFVCIMAVFISEGEAVRSPLWRAGVVLLLLAGAARTLTPSTKEMCAILVIPALANNEDVQALGDDVVTLAREWMRDLRQEKGQ